MHKSLSAHYNFTGSFLIFSPSVLFVFFFDFSHVGCLGSIFNNNLWLVCCFAFRYKVGKSML
ncbi:hypothetical protein Godav_019283 [Gossypium davidsonii]|uniref:Uncharacterized protein n=1 Tax=Gossypium davidsonii TaxID=34287 RepID=A0A7J8R0K6_GOSDV|nr:hypothetical protein [Gossypium davidsonii]